MCNGMVWFLKVIQTSFRSRRKKRLAIRETKKAPGEPEARINLPSGDARSAGGGTQASAGAEAFLAFLTKDLAVSVGVAPLLTQ